MRDEQTTATSTTSTTSTVTSSSKRRRKDDQSDDISSGNESSESEEGVIETVEDRACLYDVFVESREGMTLFMAACEFSSVIVVSEFLAKDPSLIDSTNRIGMTPMHFACYGGNLAVAQLLYNRKSELLTKLTERGDSCLAYANYNYRYSERIVHWVRSCNPQFFEELEVNNAKKTKIQGYLDLVYGMEEACKAFNFARDGEVMRMLAAINPETQLPEMITAAKKFLTSASLLYFETEPQFSGDYTDLKILQGAFKDLVTKVDSKNKNHRLNEYLQSI